MSDNPSDEFNKRNKKSQSHSYRKNNESVKCLLCGYLRTKWHKCPPSYEPNFRSSSTESRGKLSQISSPRRPPHKDYNKNYKKNNNNYCNEILSDEKRTNYRNDFYKEYYYYRLFNSCVDITSGNNLINRGIPGKTRVSDRGIDDERVRNNFERNKIDDEEDKENLRNDRWGKDCGGRRMSPEMEMKKRNAAKESYTSGKFKLALSQYSELISLFPKNEIYYGNRSACYMMMGNNERALADARKSIEINPKFIKGYYRVITFTLTTGRITELENCLSELEKINSTDQFLISTRKTLEDLNRNLLSENDARKRKDNAEALRCINKCIEISPSCITYKLRKARYLAYMERYEEADNIANDILENDKKNSLAKYILSIHMYYTDIEKALPYLENIIQQSPKMLEAQTLYQKARMLKEMKEKGNEAFRSGEFIKAHGFYTRASKIDPKYKKINKQLYNNMAQASYKLGMRAKSIRECTKALEIDDNYLKALVRRGKCYMELKNYSSAIDDFKKCCQIDEGIEYKNLLDEAKKRQEEKEREREEERKRREEERQREEEERRRHWEEFFESFNRNRENWRDRSNYDRHEDEKNQRNSDDKQRDQREEYKERSSGRRAKSGSYYAILGVDKNASLKDIKAAYMKLAKIHHPDRHANSSKEVKEENERMMKLITQAYRELTEAENTGFKFA